MKTYQMFYDSILVACLLSNKLKEYYRQENVVKLSHDTHIR